MKKILKALTKPWFWWLFGLLVTSALVWFVLPLIKFGSVQPFGSAAVRLLIILILVIVWSIVNLRLQKKAAEQGDEAQEQQDPEEVRQALTKLKTNFKKAMEIVSPGLWWERLLRRNVYQVPWYLVVGAQGSGRSSLLRYSGLPYPVANESYRQIEQQGDEYCQWWFSKEAVLIDTHGDLLTNLDEESTENRVWQELLSLLRWHRRSKPLNGVILTIDLFDLLNQSQEQKATLAHALRTQLQVLNNRLGIQCPVYVCLTKSDRLSGFMEAFGNLSSEQREQVCGFTLPYSPFKDALVTFDEEYTAFVQHLSQFFTEQLEQFSEPKHNALLANFSIQLSTLQPILKQFLGDVFESNHFQSRLALRGVFFTSAEQKGEIKDLLASAAKQNYGIDLVAQQQHSAQQSYFIQQLFKKMVLPERDILLFNSRQRQQQMWRLRFAYALAALFVVWMTYLWIGSTTENYTRLNDIQTKAKQYTPLPPTVAKSDDSVDFVLPSLNQLKQIYDIYQPEYDAGSVHRGLYQGHRIRGVIGKIYAKNLQQFFMPYVLEAIYSELNNQNAKANQLYNALRIYLMLGHPEKLRPEFARSWLNNFWRAKYEEQPGLMQAFVNNTNGLFSMKLSPVELNQAVIQQARTRLQNTSQAQRDYFELQELAEISGEEPILLSGGNSVEFGQVFGDKAAKIKIPQLFTFKGYTGLYKTKLKTVLADDGLSDWVLGQPAQHRASAKQADSDTMLQIHSYYMQDYVERWNQALGQLTIQPFDNLTQAGNRLALLSGEASPLFQVLALVHSNTVLHPKASGFSLSKAQGALKANRSLVRAVQPKGVKKVTGKARRFKPKNSKKSAQTTESVNNPLVQTPVGAAFNDLNALQTGGEDGASIQAIQAALTKLSNFVLDINTDPDPMKAAYQQVQARLSGDQKSDPLDQLLQQAKSAPMPLRDWLQSIVQYTWQAMLSKALGYINQQYQQTVLPAYNETLAGRYPFSVQSTNDVVLTDFSAFFAPKATFDKFFTSYIQPFVDTSGKSWTLADVKGGILPLTPNALKQLALAHAVTSLFFSDNTATPKFNYSIDIVDLSPQLKSATLQLGKQTLDYRHGPHRPTQFSWDGSDVNYSLTLVNLFDAKKQFTASGVWGLFKLFDQGTGQTSEQTGVINIQFIQSGKTVTYSLQVNNGQNPFAADMLHRLQLPANIGE